MELGAFSVSLSVSDLGRSRRFYETLGFTKADGDDETWLVLRNGDATIGLFQGLFEGNILTFNPGLNQDLTAPETFTDVREIQRQLVDAGIELTKSVDEDSTGPAHITLSDPDGNAILIDQFR